MHPYRAIFEQNERLAVGIMTGTSLDGVNVAIARLRGSGSTLELDVLADSEYPLGSELSDLIRENSVDPYAGVGALTTLTARLARAYEEAVRSTLVSAGLSVDDVDVVGSHGQTVQHRPDPVWIAGREVSGTLQIGDPSMLANLLECPVVGDFRMADMALGGQGAPLVPYFDWACFRSETEGRLLLNLGGIANMTVLPASCLLNDVIAFDTGPANMVLDSLARRLLDEPFDSEGAVARSGTAHEEFVAKLLDHEWFLRSPPKSTGRELFSAEYVEHLVQESRLRDLSDADILATAAALTVRSIHRAWEQFVRGRARIDRLIVSGGGVFNVALMEALAAAFGPTPVETSDRYGIPPGAKEALCFAVLAHETMNGRPTSIPSVTGARKAAILGKICIPTHETLHP